MKITYFFLFFFLLLMACHKDDLVSNRQAGAWEVEKININRIKDGQTLLDTTLENAGKIALLDNGNILRPVFFYWKESVDARHFLRNVQPSICYWEAQETAIIFATCDEFTFSAALKGKKSKTQEWAFAEANLDGGVTTTTYFVRRSTGRAK